MKQLQWFPGHMKKTLEEIAENIKLVDIVIELRDARVPLSSENPQLTNLIKDKKRLLVLTKKDLADGQFTQRWLAHFQESGIPALAFDVHRDQMLKLQHASEQQLADKFAKDRARGMKKRPIKAMIVGIPNVGKSTLINKVSRKKATVVGDKPGVTKTKQWIRLNKDMELLDTPGVLYPKFGNEEVGLRLAVVGTIKDTILPLEAVIDYLLNQLKQFYPNTLSRRFSTSKDDGFEAQSNTAIIEDIGKRRGLYREGKVVDTHQVMLLLLHELRNGKFGRVTFDRDVSEQLED